ncbi:NAD-dependent epimerase/dehydratase family protein [Desulforegula conservatrix]|uniref:NAD-dependent epimerase/dehydratase family protein n=1 Tax=Desulforegula conservatrix TaxID=153026 RepID=UPI00042344E3|nr:NAD-dependent epimerase/dehydratase family protein [Desulforegula conservatrix]
MQKVLVTGATGAIGKILVKRLVELGYSVRVFVREKSDLSGIHNSAEIFCGSLFSEKDLTLACRGVDTVFHLAAKLHINNPTPLDDKEIFRVNLDATKLLVRASWKNSVSRFVYFSTINVYGVSEERNIFDESSIPTPVTAYAKSKLGAEKYVLALVSRNTGEPAGVVLRYASVYGPNMKGNYRLLTMLAKAGIKILPGDGLNRRTLIHADDAVYAAISAALHGETPGRFFNITDGSFHSLEAIYSSMLESFGRCPSVIRIPLAPLKLVFSIVDEALCLFMGRRPLISAIEKFTEDMAVDGNLFSNVTDFAVIHNLKNGWHE